MVPLNPLIEGYFSYSRVTSLIKGKDKKLLLLKIVS